MKKSKYCLLVAFLFPLIGCSNNNSSTSSSLDSSSKLSEVVSSSTSSSSSSSTSSSAAEKNKHLIITKAATNNYVSSYFVELYNPTDTTINLSSYSLQYLPPKLDNVTTFTKFDLSGEIKPASYFLIAGKASEDATKVVYTLPQADLTLDNFTLSNKGFTLALTSSQTLLDGTLSGDSTTLNIPNLVDLVGVASNDHSEEPESNEVPLLYEKDFPSIFSKKKGFMRNSLEDSDNNKNDLVVVNYSDAASLTNDMKATNSKGEKEGKTEDTYPYDDSLVTSTKKYTGFNNENASLKVEQVARYNSKAKSKDGGSEEIVAYNPVNKFCYAVNGVKGVLTGVLQDQENLTEQADKVVDQKGIEIDIKKLVEQEDKNFEYGDLSSVSASTDNKVAVTIQSKDFTKKSKVAIFQGKTDGSLTLLKLVDTGIGSDSLKFSNDNKLIITADEGEPRNGYSNNAIDPQGSISIIDTTSYESKILDFTSFDSKRDELVKNNVILKKNSLPSKDLEPEYVSVTDTKAYISLQENNAIAEVDLATKAITNVFSLGFQDYSKVKIDLNKDDNTYSPKNYNNVFSLRMPDGISSFTKDNQTYIMTANEGDSREWGEYSNEDKKNLTSTDGIEAKKVKILLKDDYDGLKNNADAQYVFGSRSFTIFKVENNSLTEVYDSQDSLEKYTNQYLPNYFNCSNDDIELESRTTKKGPEPENIIYYSKNNKDYALVALERISGVMIFNLTDLSNVSFDNYINSRSFNSDIEDDVSIEGLLTFTNNNQDYLVTSNEVSGTLATYKLF